MTPGLWAKGVVEPTHAKHEAREWGSFRKPRIIPEWLDWGIRRCPILCNFKVQNLELIGKSYR